MIDLGDTLREARVRRDLTLKDVEDALKIRSKYLQALEQDDFEVIPGPTFVRAFLRTYAAFLGLDTERLMEEYASQFETRVPQKQTRLSRSTSSRARDRGPHRQPNYVVVGLVAATIIVILALVFRPRGDEPAVLDPEVVTTTTTADNSEPVTTTKPAGNTRTTTKVTGTTVASAEATSASTVAAAATSAGALKLVVRISGNSCFVTVREESPTGKTLYTGTMKKGDELSYSYHGRYYLNIGNPSAVQLLVDGLPVEVPEPYGQFILSKAGLERL